MHETIGGSGLGRGKKRGRHGEPAKGSDNIRKLPAVEFEDFAEADRIFRESIDDFADPPPNKEGESGTRRRTAPEAPRRDQKRSKRRTDYTVDLHGMTLSEARNRLDSVIEAVLTNLTGPVTVTVITGKGLHSGPGGAVLPREIHRHVRQTYGAYIRRLDESPADVSIGGVPLRGHFTITFGRR